MDFIIIWRNYLTFLSPISFQYERWLKSRDSSFAEFLKQKVDTTNSVSFERDINDNSLLDDLDEMVSTLPPDLSLTAPSASNLALLVTLPEVGESPSKADVTTEAQVDGQQCDEQADAGTVEEPPAPSSDSEYRVLPDGSDVPQK